MAERLIRESDVLENIDEWLETVGYATIGKNLSYYGELKGCIADAPTIEAKPNWIPVEDHLPKIDEEVIVQDLLENIFVGKIYDPTKHNKFGSYFIDIQTHCVTTGVAWMPKPTPYKAGDPNEL